jgi:type I restriction-modification system DNA methylase subunit
MKTKEDIRKVLSVSGATISNWVKTGLIPDYSSEEKAYNDSDYDQIVADINLSGKLTSRANRFQSNQSVQELNIVQSSANKALLRQLLAALQLKNLSNSASMFALCLLALKQRGLIEIIPAGEKAEPLKIKSDSPSFSNFLKDWAKQFDSEDIFGLLNSISAFTFPDDEPDFLGAVYESMRNLGEKSKLGAFFTPSFLVNDLNISSSTSVLDPCSGTGTILLSIVDAENPPKAIYLRDIDELALRIAKVNFALFFKRTDLTVFTSCENALSWNCTKKFDFIITNPPWGASSDETTEKDVLRQNPDWKNADSFDIILSQAIDKLDCKGKLVFILPESFLYVDAHFRARKKVFDSEAEIKLTFFGHAFKGVQSKVIRLELDKSKSSSVKIIRNKLQIELSTEFLKENNFRAPAVKNQAEMLLLERIMSKRHSNLKGSCKFGLGIVTGNNKKHLIHSNVQGSEAIYKGKDLVPCGFSKPSTFIQFNPKQLQQCAPEALYRSPKICYRFISDKLVMVADNNGVLLLNSANFFIPPPQFNLKALAAFFNSPICSLIYQRLFNSVKVLRSHIEQLPIPAMYFQYEDDFEKLYLETEKGKNVKQALHDLSCKVFGVNAQEIEI